jgi:L-alanine-DL-glutamate epimerase-like enolase superfamily enzyme
MEKVRTDPFGVVDDLEAGAADFVRASASFDGGITGSMKIARVAEAFGTDVEFLVGEPAHLHCLSAVRNTNYFEHALVHPQDLEWMASQGFTTDVPRVNNGFVSVPDGAGLGVEIDWSFVSERQTEHTVIDEPDDSGIA